MHDRSAHHRPRADGLTQDEAFRGATQRLIHLLDHTMGKLDRHEHRDRETIRKDLDATAG